MQRRFLFYSLLFFLLMLLCQGCDIRGAARPFSYAPTSPKGVWRPPEKALQRLAKKPLSIDLDTLETEDTPLSLGEAINLCLTYNPETKESWAEARAAAAAYGQSLQNYFPLAEIDGNYNRFRYAQFLGKERQLVYETQYGVKLKLSYLIFDFGQTRMTSEAMLQALYYADWLHNREIQKKIQNLMSIYYDYLCQKKLLLAAEQDTANALVTLDATKEKFQRGVADVSDIVQAKTSYLQQKLTLVKQQQSVSSAYALLISEMGLPATRSFFFQDYPEEPATFSTQSLDDLILQASSNRPGLLAAEAALKSTLATLSAARKERFPKVTGDFAIGQRYYDTGVNSTYEFAAIVGVKFPLFQGFFISNTIRQAEANVEDAKARLDQVKLGIIQEVSTYRSATVNAREALIYAQDYLAAAEEEYDVNLQRYRCGTGTIIDLTNALTSVANARAQLANTENTWYRSVTDLAYAIGVLFPPKEAAQPIRYYLESEEPDA